MFVIQIETNGSKKYLTVDHQSGGYRYWTNHLPSALFLNTVEDAEKELNDSDFKRTSEMSSGEIHPPRLIHSGLELSYNKQVGTGTISIVEINLKTVKSHDIKSSLIVGYSEQKQRVFVREGF